MSVKPRLPVDVCFVVRYADKWRSLIDAAPAVSANATADATVDDLHDRIASNEDCWITSTYLQLRRLVSNVRLVDRAVPGCINVVSGLDFGIRDVDAACFYVGTRSDGPAPTLCHMAVVQNGLQEAAGAGHCIPHWPQPALIARRDDRGDRIENLVFYGSETNLDARFRSSGFLGELQRLGVALRVNGRDANDRVAWNDYAEADLVLAARNLTRGDAFTKPASKLVNAWLANVPALLGPEPVFRDLRRSGLDYLEVSQPAEVLAAVARLQADPERYRAMQENGRVRGQAFTAERIAQQWIAFLCGPAAQTFARWCRAGRVRRSSRWLAAAVAHKWARARASKIRESGPRILGAEQA